MSDTDEGWRVVPVVPTLEMHPPCGINAQRTAYANAVAALTGKVAE